MNDEERAAIYAAMAEINDDEQAERDARNPFLSRSGERTVKIPLPDGSAIEVPSMAYVGDLERKLQAQAKKIEKFEKAFLRIDSKLRAQRVNIVGQSNRINDVNRELEQKIDRRD